MKQTRDGLGFLIPRGEVAGVERVVAMEEAEGFNAMRKLKGMSWVGAVEPMLSSPRIVPCFNVC
jgi:hypothetical protein